MASVMETQPPDIPRTRVCPCSGCGRADTADTVARWHARTGPAPLLRARHRLDSGALPRWVDHPYRLRLPDGRWRYVAEPYELSEDALCDLAFLAGRGFRVAVTAWRARHYPGHTVAVEIDVRPLDGAA